MDEREKRLLKLVDLRGIIDILRHLDEHGTGQYKDFNQYANVPTLNARLKQLLGFTFNKSHFQVFGCHFRSYRLDLAPFETP